MNSKYKQCSLQQRFCFKATIYATKKHAHLSVKLGPLQARKIYKGRLLVSRLLSL